MSCKDLDGPLARLEDPELAKLLEKFVCVRVIQGWGLDLARFQFDGDLTWAAMFVHFTGTVLGRYGGRKNSTAGFRKAAEGALELHAAFPGNARELEGKRGSKPAWPTPESIPALKGRPNIKPATGERAACIHCHQIMEGELWTLRGESKTLADQVLWAYPAPEDVGLEFDIDERATVKSVSGTAKEAGFKPGDRILRLGGQAILSIADVQWVLHHAPDVANLGADVEREGEPGRVNLRLKSGWRRAGDYTWRSIAWSLRHRLAGTGPLENVPSTEPGMALKIKQIPPNWVKDRNLTAAKALRAGDIIIAVDGKNDLIREADFLAFLLQKRPSGSTVPLTIRRGAKTVEATITLP